jgi:hypothetical protein
MTKLILYNNCESNPEKNVNSHACKMYYLINNYCNKLGTISMLPAKTRFGNNSRTKKIPTLTDGVALAYAHCSNPECKGSTSSADLQIIIGDTIILTSMLAVHYLIFHYSDIDAETLEIIDNVAKSFNDYDENATQKTIEELLIKDKFLMYPIDATKYFALLRA